MLSSVPDSLVEGVGRSGSGSADHQLYPILEGSTTIGQRWWGHL